MSRVSYPSPYIITKDTIGSDLRWEDLSAQCDGSNVTFTLSEEADPERIFVYYNGLLNNPDITASTETTFTLDFAPYAEDSLQVIYSVKGNPQSVDD